MQAEAQSLLCESLEHRERTGNASRRQARSTKHKASAPLQYPVLVGFSVLSAPALVLFWVDTGRTENRHSGEVRDDDTKGKNG